MPTTTVTNALPQWLQDYMATAAQRGLAIGNMPFQPYGGQMVAPLSPAQQAGIDMIQARATSGSPLMMNAQNQLNSIIGGNYLPGSGYSSPLSMRAGPETSYGGNAAFLPTTAGTPQWSNAAMQGSMALGSAPATTQPQRAMFGAPAMGSEYGISGGNVRGDVSQTPTRNTSLDMAPFSQQQPGSIFPGNAPGTAPAGGAQTPIRFGGGMQGSLQANSSGGSGGGNPFYGTVSNLANGGGLGGNPYLSGIMQTTQNDIQSRMGQLGYGSGSFGNSGVQSTAARELANSANALQYQNYNDARNQQMQALGLGSGMYESERARQMQALGMAPGMAQSDYYDAAQLLGAGSLQRGVNQDINQANYNEFLRGQNWPFQTQDAFIRSLGLNPGSTQSTTSPDPNQAAQYLGYGIGALGLANLGTSLWDWWGS